VTPAVRTFKNDDLDDVVALIIAAWGALDGIPASIAHEFVEPGNVKRDVAQRARSSLLLVAQEPAGADTPDEGASNGDIIGIVNYTPGPDDPYAEFDDADAAGIRMLGVRPDAQGRGVGAALVHECVRRARAQRKQRIVLHTTPWMPTARRLYSKLGFRRAPERDFTPLEDVELLGYVMDLTKP
jgi:ribosomal protein S18 acetylase RimI-like enzyme